MRRIDQFGPYTAIGETEYSATSFPTSLRESKLRILMKQALFPGLPKPLLASNLQ
jgi:hypothetical protein